MKRILLFVLALVLLTGCSVGSITPQTQESVIPPSSTIIPSPDSTVGINDAPYQFSTFNITDGLIDLDLEERRGNISYRVSSEWRKRADTEEDIWFYYPHEENVDGYFLSSLATINTDPNYDPEVLIGSLNDFVEGVVYSEGKYDYQIFETVDLDGVPIQQFTCKEDVEESTYIINGFAFVYPSNNAYMVSSMYPETDNTDFFPSTLTSIMNTLVIDRQNEIFPTDIEETLDSILGDLKDEVSGIIGENVQDAQSVEEQYQAIFDDYSDRIKKATPILIEEYFAEAETNSEGIFGLAEINTAKIYQLAEISTEGISKMAEVMLKSGSGDSSEYESWANKLTKVYEDEAEKITDVYMESAS